MTLPRSSYIVISTSLAFDRPLTPKSPAEFDVALGCEASGNG